MLEAYIKKVQIEARVMGDLASTMIIPAAVKYQNELITNVSGLKNLGIKGKNFESQLAIIEKLSEHINSISIHVTSMIEARKSANEIAHTRDKAIAYCNEVKDKHFDSIRYHVDKLELIVDDEKWPLPKYRELLFLR